MDESFIKEQLKELGGNVSKLARVLGMDYSEVRYKYGTYEAPVRRSIPRPADFRDLAQPWLRHRAIAVKRVCEDWPDEFADVIHSARRAYDRGTHIMCQHTGDHGWAVLYLIPRKRPIRNAKPYFFTGEYA